ncbi:MAG: 1-(5-phosphoribosyl)-5-[(5-phosphoribosylamino)methylideneamino]imidazole-4-carboxamide isomerase [Defluviitaleaceae bacterium]|nr:1-(5-phosphoribosyl)-5-[(5-phosphoribosylamino)methylideneamino]imidazole-4-carboxamide isomerase [Defluviitaleaceae bacterium]
MLIIPAIDLQGGQAVRLLQGDYGKKTVYSDDPVKVAQGFETMGAKYLHVVDLDGAKSGSTANLETIRRIREGISIPMQLGGGVRSGEIVDMYLKMGINRVILGTIAVSNPGFVAEMIEKHGPERIVVGVDVRFSNVEGIPGQARDDRVLEGFISTAGWLEDSKVNYLEFIENIKSMGVEYLVVTDISRDGTLTSPNWDLYETIQGINVVVSGGVATEEHIAQAAKYYAVIVGKAHYEGRVDLEKCIRQYQG